MMMVLSMMPMTMRAVMPGLREMGRMPSLSITVLRSAIATTTSSVAMKIPNRTYIRTGMGMPKSSSINYLWGI